MEEVYRTNIKQKSFYKISLLSVVIRTAENYNSNFDVAKQNLESYSIIATEEKCR